MTSIKDVAREVGVSTATVSRALRGLPRVSENTRSKVLQVARQLDYAPSPQAAGLASGRTHAVGIIVPFVTRWFYGSIMLGAEEVFREQGYDLLVYNLAGGHAARQRIFHTHALHKRVDAVMVLNLIPSKEELASLARLGRPAVIVGARLPGWASVSIDDVHAAEMAVQHLVGLGHRRIGHVSGSLGQLDDTANRDRLEGYRSVMKSTGLGAQSRWEVARDYTGRGGFAATQRLLQAEPAPTAIFAATDELAIGAVHAGRAAGLRVPEDLSVIGIDDHELAEFFDLTTVAAQVPEQGRLAAQLLLKAMGGCAEVESSVLTVATRLIERGTTAAAHA